MSIYFGSEGYENLFKKALLQGINLFCGAGFSVESENKHGNRLPVGAILLEELKSEFPTIHAYSNLPRACTKLTQTDKDSFYRFLKTRLSVAKFNPLYHSLLDICIKNIYTTNIDDLFYKIFDATEKANYLNDRSSKGGVVDDKLAINYYPLHGCIRSTDNYVFGVTELASAFSYEGSRNAWNSLAKDSSIHSILFWGWNFADPGPIEAMYGGKNKTNDNINRWILLRNPDEETQDFLKSLNFNIIIGDTIQMLEYIDGLKKTVNLNITKPITTINQQYLNKHCIPSNDDTLPSFPLSSFFLDYTPRWSHIYSHDIPKTSHYKKIADSIAANNNVVFIGIRGSGKTTLLMQLAVNIETIYPKHFIVAPSLEQITSYIKLLNGSKSILYIDDCFRDTNALIEVLKCSNIQVVCCDRDFNFERQFHKIQSLQFERVDITEITPEDAQSIINIIPTELKKEKISTKKFVKDPTMVTVLAISLKSMSFNFIKDFYKKDPEAAKIFLMICYVHSCGVACSFDMIYSFLGDEKYSWNEMYDILARVGGLIKDCSDYFGNFDIFYSIQDYYQCRSPYFAERIIENIPENISIFSDMLFEFAQNVPAYKICSYDKFKRKGYDADFATRAFSDIEKGRTYYNICALKDESEYIYQQAAIYFSRKNKLKEAFLWIDKARNLSHYNRFSIDSTYAKLYFSANLNIDNVQSEKALDILRDCCTKDKRKSIHFSTFARCVLDFNKIYPGKNSLEYINIALSFIDEGLDDKNLSLSKKNHWELQDLKEKLKTVKELYSH